MIPALAAKSNRCYPLAARNKLAIALHILTMIFVFVIGASLAEAAQRAALVIGNADYANVPRLQNPVNDAQDIARVLTGVGFKVIEVENAGRARMVQAVADFSQDIKDAEVALFYYAGHGMQMEGQNYLLPIDAKIETPADARFATLNLADIQDEMASAGRANIIVLDACRNNPFARTLAASGRAIGERGLGRIEAKGAGSLIVFSTQPDNIAVDGAGRNSPFAEALARNISAPGVEVRQMISRVRAQVMSATQKKQVPWDNSSLVGDVYLAEAAPAARLAQASPPAEVAPHVSAEPAPEAKRDAAECEKYAQQTKPFATPDEIKAARRLRDWKRALPFCKAAVAADPGSARMHYLLAGAYSMQKDYFNAMREAKIAVDAGDAGAAVLIGYMYVNGLGVLKNYSTAAEIVEQEGGAIERGQRVHHAVLRGGADRYRQANSTADVWQSLGESGNLGLRKSRRGAFALDRKHERRNFDPIRQTEIEEPSQTVAVEKFGLPGLAVQFFVREQIGVGDDFGQRHAALARAHFPRILVVPALGEELLEHGIEPFGRRVQHGAFGSVVQHLGAEGARRLRQFMENASPQFRTDRRLVKPVDNLAKFVAVKSHANDDANVGRI